MTNRHPMQYPIQVNELNSDVLPVTTTCPSFLSTMPQRRFNSALTVRYRVPNPFRVSRETEPSLRMLAVTRVHEVLELGVAIAEGADGMAR